ncbi:hypothetical protein [Methylococcus sp. EFPC2]|nr:hypothetical protein [Methylococcus sp. EFPC2]QSA95844.1 hypothetical protein JWZ97_11390 [Methylococcus sp. EFPC2]
MKLLSILFGRPQATPSLESDQDGLEDQIAPLLVWLMIAIVFIALF